MKLREIIQIDEGILDSIKSFALKKLEKYQLDKFKINCEKNGINVTDEDISTSLVPGVLLVILQTRKCTFK